LKQYRGRHYRKKNKVNTRAKNINLFFVLFVVAIIILSMFVSNIMAYFTSIDSTIQQFTIKADYTVVFHANGGSGDMSPQNISFNVATPLTKNSFQRSEYVFRGWNTAADGSGQAYSDEQEVNNIVSGDSSSVDLYAQWILENAVAEMNGEAFTSLQSAIDLVTDQDGQVTIKLLQNTRERITVGSGKDIVVNLQNNTLKNDGNYPVIVNEGSLKLVGGTVETETKTDGAINNESGGRLIVDNTRVIMGAASGKQAVYNNGGYVEILEDSYLYSISTSRATIQNQEGGTMVIKGGIIISTGYAAAVNNGTDFTIGTEDGSVNKLSPILQGATYGVTSAAPFNFYDGKIKGKTGAKSGATTFNDTEDGYEIIDKNEVIDGSLYKTQYLGNETILELNRNDGTTGNELHLNAEDGEIIEPIPTITRPMYRFDGWFSLPEGGEELTESTQITENTTYYAHWTRMHVAELDGTEYYTVQEAINQISATDGIEKNITLLYDVQEVVTISAGMKVNIDLQGYTMFNNGTTRVIDNYGTLTISNGTITSNASQGAINNEKSGVLIMNSGRIIATGIRQAIYNNGGRVEISGTAYLSATAGERAAVQNLNSGTILITGGEIVSTGYSAIVNDSGTITIGEKDDDPDTTTPTIQGKIFGIKNSSTFNFYNGTLKGKNAGISGSVSDKEAGYTTKTGTEQIGGETYRTAYLGS